MLRNDVPPPAPAVMPSMSRPASLNIPFCSATAQGSVATRRPYWLTVIFAAQAGVTAKVITAVASAAWNHMVFSPFTPALIAGSLCQKGLYIRLSATRKVAARRYKRDRPEERHENRARRSDRGKDPHPPAPPGYVPLSHGGRGRARDARKFHPGNGPHDRRFLFSSPQATISISSDIS